MTTQTPDHERRETSSYKTAYNKIGNVLDRLSGKNVCPHCTARAMAFHAASFAEYALGSAEAVQLFEEMISILRKHDALAPERGPSTEMH